MRKVLLGLVLLVVLAGALSPILFSFYTERVFGDVAARTPRISVALGASLGLDANAYDAGPFRSEVRTPLGAGPGSEVILHHVIRHGPIAYGALDRGLVAAVVETTVELDSQTAPPRSPVRMVTTLGLDRSVRVELSGEPTQTDGFELERLDGSLEISDEGGRWSGQMELTGLSLDAPTTSMDLGDMRLEIDTRPSPNGIPLGSARVSVDRASVRTIAGPDFRVRDLEAYETITLEDEAGTLDARATLRMGELLLNAEERVELRGVDFEFAARNLDDQGVAELRTATPNLPPGAGAAQWLASLQQAFTTQSQRILRAGPELEIIRGRATTPDGLVELRLELEGREDMAGVPVLLSGPGILSVFDLDLSLDLGRNHFGRLLVALARGQAQRIGIPPDSPAFAEWVGKVEDSLIRDGYVRLEGLGQLTRYRATLSSRDGLLEINGRPVDVGKLLGPEGVPF